MQRLVCDLTNGTTTIIDLTPEEIAAIPPPEHPPVPAAITFAQALIGLVQHGWISESEADAWLNRTALPSVISAVINSLPSDQRFAAKARAYSPAQVERESPLLLAIASAAGKSSAQVDEFFTICAQL